MLFVLFSPHRCAAKGRGDKHTNQSGCSRPTIIQHFPKCTAPTKHPLSSTAKTACIADAAQHTYINTV